jgi:sulfite reductase (ferredoxin)
MPSRTPGQGQWALGHREPLNANERFKRDDDGLAVRDRILTSYSVRGFDSIDPTDLRGRFRWWGLYTQRRAGIPGGQTATLDPAELDDSHFMLRVRIDGGRLSAAQLRVVGEVARDYGRDVADVTDRANVQLHWIRIEDVPAIWTALEAVGLTTAEACGDTPRVMIGCPLAGVDAGEVLDATSALTETAHRFVGDPTYSNLPRKFKTAISGCPDHCTLHEVNDVAFVGVVGPDGRPGFDLWVGGGLSTNPQLAVRLGAFVTPDRVPQLFRDYGYRRSRTRARLKFLVRDWGPEKFRRVLEDEYVKEALPDGPPPAPPRSPSRDHVGLLRQHDGRYAVGVTPNAGRTSGSALLRLAELADSYGSGQIRATTHQKLVLLDVELVSVPALAAGLEAIDLPLAPPSFRASTIACTGIEFCKLAIVETKERAAGLAAELDRRLPGFAERVGIHVNGCPNSCARFQIADIGLKGSLVDGGDGFQVHLGGHLGETSRLARKLRGLKLPADVVADYIEGLLRRYDRERADGESFADWVARADEAVLR